MIQYGPGHGAGLNLGAVQQGRREKQEYRQESQGCTSISV
jgi:hypothetical protein